MQDFVIDWLNSNHRLAWLVVLSFAFLEACPGVGLFVSGIFLLSICTLLYAQDMLPLGFMMALAFSGACLSDHLGFYAGRWIGPKFHRTKFATNRRDVVKRAEEVVKRFGVFSILFGRLIPAVRSKVPLLVGISGFDRLKFTAIDIFACTIWSGGLGILVVGLQTVFSG